MSPALREHRRRAMQLLAELDDYEDLRDAYARVQQGIRDLRRSGAPVPEELLHCERRILTELTAESQGR
jgi:hypothetical protein